MIAKLPWKLHIPTIYNFLKKQATLWQLLLCFLFINNNFTSWLNNLKTRTAMNAKTSMFFICVEAIIFFYYINLLGIWYICLNSRVSEAANRSFKGTFKKYVRSRFPSFDPSPFLLVCPCLFSTTLFALVCCHDFPSPDLLEEPKDGKIKENAF